MAIGDVRDLDRIADGYTRRMHQIKITPEMEEQARRVICGSSFVNGPKEASTILQALGLIPYLEVRDGTLPRDADA